MKKQLLLPLASAAGGAAALVLRLLQNKTGFEAATGLPVPGNAPGTALTALLAVLAAALYLLARLLPAETEDGPFFPEDFRTVNAALVALPVVGIFLMAVSGALDIAAGAALMNSLEAVGGPDGPSVIWSTWGASSGLTFTPKARILAGALALIAAVSLFPPAACCRRRPGVRPRTASPVLLLVSPVCMVSRLVLAYRVDSVNPALQAYYVEILALTFMTLAFYRLSSFAYHAAKPRRFALYAGAAVVLCLAALADGESLSALLLYAGGAAVLLGFLLLWLTEGQSVSEIVESGGL
ncbi:hypothetical protein [Oscillibacter sp. 1-3]|uniref:hypothetical protein n=1 Tax=Oscillibacter sp. 1-3 TaxID=1235797 RepID=UPI000335D8E5|nr:hypothetical protein [Oscillibacter sp. 1-3]EOS66020.1 hypothetical protein C816_01875 [Oscillibacter sp. 1-3]